jgi:hypothetical protein
LNRDYVKELTVQIPNNFQCEFHVEQEALDYYRQKKEEGKVQVTWLTRVEEAKWADVCCAILV